MNPKICTYALGHLNHQLHQNRVSSCFRCVAKLGDHKQQLMSEIVNSEDAKKHRLTLMNGQWPDGCGSCRDFENNGLISTRLEGLQHPEFGLNLNDYDPITGEISHVKTIELRFGNECNLSCRHCSPGYSSKWSTLLKKDPTLWGPLLWQTPELDNEPTIRQDYIDDILKNLVPKLMHISFSGGETLYQKQHYEFIAAIPEEHAAHIQLLYVTNGTVTEYKKYNVFDLWKKFKKVVVVVSTDGVLERYNYFRQGADWTIVEKNMRAFKNAGYDVYAEITCSVYQLFYLSETIDYLYDNNLAIDLSSSIVQNPLIINPRIVPADVKKTLIDNWDQYLSSINDPAKHARAKAIGSYPINYMMGDINELPYGLPLKGIPTWQDFANSVYIEDRLFKRSVRDSMPLLADCLPKPLV